MTQPPDSKELIQPKQKRSLESKEKIFQAAQSLFARHGPDGISVDEIAEKTQVNKQRIYAYFGSKKISIGKSSSSLTSMRRIIPGCKR